MLRHFFFYCSKKKSQFWINSIVLKNQIKTNHDTLQSRFCIDNHCLTIHDGAIKNYIEFTIKLSIYNVCINVLYF